MQSDSIKKGISGRLTAGRPPRQNTAAKSPRLFGGLAAMFYVILACPKGSKACKDFLTGLPGGLALQAGQVFRHTVGALQILPVQAPADV